MTEIKENDNFDTWKPFNIPNTQGIAVGWNVGRPIWGWVGVEWVGRIGLWWVGVSSRGLQWVDVGRCGSKWVGAGGRG